MEKTVRAATEHDSHSRKWRLTTGNDHSFFRSSRLRTRISRLARVKKHLVCGNEHFTSRNGH
jgi:hypothetical protein